MNRHTAIAPIVQCATVLAGLLLAAVSLYAAEQPAATAAARQLDHDSSSPAAVCESATQGSPYIPVDSWVYPAVLRLYSMGYADHVYLGMRPWTRSSLSHMLENIDAQIEDANNYGDPTAYEAQNIYSALMLFLNYDAAAQCLTEPGHLHMVSAYSVIRGISGTPLRDSYHLGSTIINDYGRPYESGINNYTGVSGYATAGRFTLYVRGEIQGAPSAAGYSQSLAEELSFIDGTTYSAAGLTDYFLPQSTIPMGPIASTAQGRFLEVYLSAKVLNHEISFGKQDEWLGPGLGGSMAYSNNAENIYSFQINRVEPLQIPLLSRITGPFRYVFLMGELRGHDYIPNPANPGGTNPNLPNVINPGNPWVHLEKINFRPTENLEFGFERTVIWGGEGHEPITIKSFLRSFFSTTAGVGAINKFGRNDPGARFATFDFSYRLPFLRNWVTLYTDSELHDDISPIDAPHRAAMRPGIYLSHVPGIPKLDLRVEAASTDPSSSNGTSQYGHFLYWETIQRQGYTNQGQLFGDWIGREDKGGQAWLTYHLSGDEQLQVGWRNQKATTYFIPGGTTLNDANFQAVKRIGKNFEINGNFSFEHWKAPIYPTGTPTYPAGQQTVTTTTIQLTWFPTGKINF